MALKALLEVQLVYILSCVQKQVDGQFFSLQSFIASHEWVICKHNSAPRYLHMGHVYII